MARVTVEDCIVRIPNRFRLVMIAAQRSRELSKGLDLTVERDNDKNPVVALREIAEDTVEIDELEVALIRGQQKHIDIDEPTEDGDEFVAVKDTFSEPGIETESSEAPDVSDDPLARALAGTAFDDVDAVEEPTEGNDTGADGPEPDQN
jgi:DNA-directed RNA polymerase subunit omega